MDCRGQVSSLGYIPPGAVGNCSVALAPCPIGLIDQDADLSTPCIEIYVLPPSAPAEDVADKLSRQELAVIIVFPVAFLILLCIFVIVCYRRGCCSSVKGSSSLANFDQEFEELRKRGVIIGERATSPREIRRRSIRLLTRLGEGAFGSVMKGLLDEPNRGVPEYTVAVKVQSSGFLHLACTFSRCFTHGWVSG
jgi:hypothetical protein